MKRTGPGFDLTDSSLGLWRERERGDLVMEKKESGCLVPEKI